jgi:hypothetical protein
MALNQNTNFCVWGSKTFISVGKNSMFSKFAGKNLFCLFAKPIQDPFLLENA